MNTTKFSLASLFYVVVFRYVRFALRGVSRLFGDKNIVVLFSKLFGNTSFLKKIKKVVIV